MPHSNDAQSGPSCTLFSYEPGVTTVRVIVRLVPAVFADFHCLLAACCFSRVAAGPWPEAASQFLPPDYIQLAEACWARQAMTRPSAEQVLQRLLDMLAVVEGRPSRQEQP